MSTRDRKKEFVHTRMVPTPCNSYPYLWEFRDAVFSVNTGRTVVCQKSTFGGRTPQGKFLGGEKWSFFAHLFFLRPNGELRQIVTGIVGKGVQFCVESCTPRHFCADSFWCKMGRKASGVRKMSNFCPNNAPYRLPR